MKENEIQNANAVTNSLKNQFNEFRIKVSAIIRLLIGVFFTLLVVATILFLVNNFGEGTNFFQKVVNSWPVIVAGILIGGVFSYFVTGKEKIKTLGFEVKNIFRT